MYYVINRFGVGYTMTVWLLKPTPLQNMTLSVGSMKFTKRLQNSLPTINDNRHSYLYIMYYYVIAFGLPSFPLG